MPAIDFKKIPGNDGHLHPMARKVQFVAMWKKHKSNEWKDLPGLGVFAAPDEVQARCEMESQKNPEFVRRYRGGTFFAMDISNTYTIDPGLEVFWGLGGGANGG